MWKPFTKVITKVQYVQVGAPWGESTIDLHTLHAEPIETIEQVVRVAQYALENKRAALEAGA